MGPWAISCTFSLDAPLSCEVEKASRADRLIQSLADLYDASAQSISPHLAVTLSDDDNVLGQLHTIYGLVGIAVDQAVARLKVPVFTHRQ